jgi:hypothetical protein
MGFNPKMERRHLAGWFGKNLPDPKTPCANPLAGAYNLYWTRGLEGLLFGLDEPAHECLQLARVTLDRAFSEGVRPYRGGPGLLEYNDDRDLNHHWAIAHKASYLIDTLLGGGRVADLTAGIEHLRRLEILTNGLRGPIEASLEDILSLALWLGIVAGEFSYPLEMANAHIPVESWSPAVITNYRSKDAYLRMLWMVANHAQGHYSFTEAARKSLGRLLRYHSDYGRGGLKVALAGAHFAFDWAWLWERVFTETPNVEHALGILRSEVSLDA